MRRVFQHRALRRNIHFREAGFLFKGDDIHGAVAPHLFVNVGNLAARCGFLDGLEDGRWQVPEHDAGNRAAGRGGEGVARRAARNS